MKHKTLITMVALAALVASPSLALAKDGGLFKDMMRGREVRLEDRMDKIEDHESDSDDRFDDRMGRMDERFDDRMNRTGEGMDDRRELLMKRFSEKKDLVFGKRQEHVAKLSDKVSGLIVRMETILGKITTRTESVKATGTDVTTVQKHIDEARTALDTAKTALASAQASLESSLGSGSDDTVKPEMKTLMSSVRESLMSAKTHMVEAVRALAALK